MTNAGPETAALHVLPTAWFRNTWSWDTGQAKPVLAADGERRVRIGHPFAGTLELTGAAQPAMPELLFCENETNTAALFGAPPVTPYPKDGINDHVVGAAATVNPARTGTKYAFWYRLEVPAGGTTEVRLRLRPAAPDGAGPAGAAPALARHCCHPGQ